MRLGFWIVAAFFVLAASMGNAQVPAAKLALVIGIADYDGDGRVDASDVGAASSESRGFVPDLRNPLNDAVDMRDALRRIDFDVDYVANADAAAMNAALSRFGAKVATAPSDAQVLIYYAGHAIQVDGANFLIPAKAKLPALDFATVSPAQARGALASAFVSIDRVLDTFREPHAPGVNLLVLDSCRNNPWAQSVAAVGRSARASGPPPRGMARIEATIPRTVIFFSTAPGATASDGDARNSPFTVALKARIGEPGAVGPMVDDVGGDVQRATGGRQIPWSQGANVGAACLARCLDDRLIGNVLPNDGRPWHQRLAAGPRGYAAQRFGISVQMMETRDAADFLAAIDLSTIGQMRADAARGDAFAQVVYGWVLLTGKSGAPDPNAAMRLFREAAAVGHPAGQEAYGNLLAAGQFGASQAVEGLRLLNLSVDQGWGSAAFSLADIYTDGRVVQKDSATAARYHARAAERGHIYAMNHYANALATGNGVAKNGPLALQWYLKAAQAGNFGGAYGAGRMLARGEAGVPADYLKALAILEQSYAMRNFDSAFELGRLYELGLGVAADRAKALRYYQEAARSAPEPSIRAAAGQAAARLAAPPIPRASMSRPREPNLPFAITWDTFNALGRIARVGAWNMVYTTAEPLPALEPLVGRDVQIRGVVRARRWAADPEAFILGRASTTRVPRPGGVDFSQEVAAVYLRAGQKTPTGTVTIQGTLNIWREHRHGVAIEISDATVID